MGLWYLQIETSPPLGPMSTAQILAAAKQGKVPVSARVRAQDAREWMPLTAAPGFRAVLRSSWATRELETTHDEFPASARAHARHAPSESFAAHEILVLVLLSVGALAWSFTAVTATPAVLLLAALATFADAWRLGLHKGDGGSPLAWSAAVFFLPAVTLPLYGLFRPHIRTRAGGHAFFVTACLIAAALALALHGAG
jgi:hypothetical protein